MPNENIKIEYIKVSELKFADYNPRKATKQEFENLKENIEKFGFLDPIIVNSNPARKNIIIGGHFRTRIAKELKMDSVPVVYVDIAEVEKEKELNVRLNKNTGSFDFDLLANFFDNNELLSYGFTMGELGMGDNENGKEKIDVDNMAAGLEGYMNSDIKQIVIYIKGTEFAEICNRLDGILPELGAENYSEAFIKLLENHENNV